MNPGLAEIRVRGHSLTVLPGVAIKMFVAALAIALLAAWLMEHAGIPYLEKEGIISAGGWRREQATLVDEYRKRNLATPNGDAVWRSIGLQVAPTKRTSKRILVIGDSFVWGYGNADVNLLWWRQLERELHRIGYRDVEVLGAGWSGWSTSQQLRAAPGLIARYAPDLVIWGYVTNDPDEGLIPQTHQSHANSRLFARFSQVFPDLALLLADRRERKLAAQGKSYESWELALLRGANWKRYEQTVRSLARFMREIDPPSFVITLPNSPSPEHFEPRYAPLRDLWSRERIHYVDTLPDFIREYGIVPRNAGSEVLAWGANPADAHPGARAVRFFAKSAARAIESRYPSALPPRVHSQSLRRDIVVNDWVPASLMTRQPERNAPLKVRVPPEAELLRMPLERAFFQLNLSEPVDLAAIRVQGRGLEKASVYVTQEHPATHVASVVPVFVGEVTQNLPVKVPREFGRLVGSVIVAPEFRASDRSLEISFVPRQAQ